MRPLLLIVYEKLGNAWLNFTDISDLATWRSIDNNKSVGIGIIHLSLVFLCALCALCGLIIPKKL